MNFRACKGCVHFYKYWANRDGLGNRTVSGYRCSARNGKLTKFPRQCKLRKEAENGKHEIETTEKGGDG